MSRLIPVSWQRGKNIEQCNEATSCQSLNTFAKRWQKISLNFHNTPSIKVYIIRRISVQELREAMMNGVMIEDYPNDKYGPSCLILGFTPLNRPLHIQCSYPNRPLVKIITLYEPNPARWVDFKVRRTQDGK